jgi:hypothetical protein
VSAILSVRGIGWMLFAFGCVLLAVGVVLKRWDES